MGLFGKKKPKGQLSGHYEDPMDYMSKPKKKK
jgi:hypothetical protein